MLTPVIEITMAQRALSTAVGTDFFQWLDLGDSVVINGIVYSSDLTTIKDIYRDPKSQVGGMAPYAYATGIAGIASASYSSALSPYVDSWRFAGKYPMYVCPNQSPRLAVFGNQRGFASGGGVTGYDSEGYQPAAPTIAGNNPTALDAPMGAFRIGDRIIVPGRSTSLYYTVTFDEQGNWLANDTGLSGMGSDTPGYWVATGIIPCTNGLLLIISTCTQSTTRAWCPGGMTVNGNGSVVSATSFTKTVAYPFASGIRVGTVPDEIGTGYVIHMGGGDEYRFIEYVTCTDVSVSNNPSALSVTKVTADYSGLIDGIAMQSSAVDLDARITGAIMKQGGTKYLVIVLHPWQLVSAAATKVLDYNRIVTYKIDNNDPTKLTLVEYRDVQRAAVVMFDEDNHRIFCTGNNGSTQLYEIANGQIFAVDTFPNVDGHWLLKTETGNIINVNPYINKAYNLSITSPTVVHARLLSNNPYNGVPTMVQVKVDVTNGTGVGVATNVKLQLVGGTFSNGTDTITVATSVTGSTYVPVTVTSNRVSVAPTLA